MSPAGNLDKYWIDNNFSYLKNRLGLLPLFEPSGLFYDDLGQLGEGGNLAGVAVRAAENIFSHANLPTIPVAFASGMTNAGEFQFSEQPGLPGRIIPSGIRISDKYAIISDPRARGMAVGTILAHEIAHYCLMKNEILRQTVDNERLTDLALMVLGLGKLWFNGRNLVVEERTEHLGYLTPLDMTYAFMEYARHAGISLQVLSTNLSPDAHRLLLSWLNQVNTGIKETRHEEELSEDEERRISVVAMQEQLERDVQNTVESIQTQKKSLATAVGDQDIINKTIRFWEIAPDDHHIMGEFVTALSSGSYEADFTGISQSLGALKREVMQISGELKPAVGKDWNVPRWKITDLTHALATLQGRIMTVRLRISEVRYIHKKCYLQLDLVQEDLETTHKTVKSCKNMMKEIQFLHEFFLDNQRTWPRYQEDSVLAHTISDLLRAEEEKENLTRTDQEAARVMSFLSSPREKYGELFGGSLSLKEIASRARSEKEGVVAMLHTLQSLHASQIALIDKYLKQASLLEFRLDDTLATAARIGKEIPELKSRQDVLKAWRRRISIARQDIAEIRVITQAVRSPGLEGEITHSTQILGEIRNAVREDAERVKSRSESNRISPVETHWKGYEAEEENIQQVTARFLRWKETQQIYLDQIERIKQRSLTNIIWKYGIEIEESVRKLGKKDKSGKKK